MKRCTCTDRDVSARRILATGPSWFGLILAAGIWFVLLPTAARADSPPSYRGEPTDTALPAPSVATNQVQVAFRSAGDGAAVASVDLWFTRDQGGHWDRWNGPTGKTSPITFVAEADGLYGFFLVLHNAAGASSAPPEPGTKPQQSIRIDRTAPIVQVMEFRSDEHFEINREIHLRWVAKDDDLPDRPVSLHYRTEQTKAYRLIMDHLAAASSYRWTVPSEAVGRIEVKISATDRAGNTARYVADWLRVDPSGRAVKMPPAPGYDLEARDEASQLMAGTPRVNLGRSIRESDTVERAGATPSRVITLRPDERPSVAEPGRTGAPTDADADEVPGMGIAFRDPPAAAMPVDEKSAQAAVRLYEAGTYHRLRGEHDLAVARLREAVRLDPGLLAARNDLAGVLVLQGDRAAAESEYLVVLAKDPTHASALKGLALLQSMERNYQSARRTLERLLQAAPEDAEGWLYLGDVTMLAGERGPAREAWRKAAGLNGAEDELRRRAEKRLSIYRETPGK